MTLTDLIGADTQAWMSTPGRNCDTDRLFAKEVQFKADLWFPSEKRETSASPSGTRRVLAISSASGRFALPEKSFRSYMSDLVSLD